MFDINKVMEVLHGTEMVYGHLTGVGDYEICSARELAEVLESQQHGEWERMENAYGELEGFMCVCGRQSNEASKFCPSCGRKMSGGEKL